MSTSSVATRTATRLTDAEMHAWRGMLHATTELRRRLAAVSQDVAGLSEADYAVLVALVEADGRMLRSAELADSISWERSRVSHHVGRMEARGLVERQACPTDSRGAELHMTDAGLAAIRLASGSHLRGLKSLFADALTDRQIDDLGEIMDAIAQHLAASDD